MPIPSIDINSNYYIMTSYGGWSPCIQGNNAYGLRPFAGSVLPNCVGFCVGRWNELMQLGACTYLASVDAKYLYGVAIGQGCTPSSDPVVGALMVWTNADDGHAAIVEQVINHNKVVASESGWNYTSAPIVRHITRTRGGGDWSSSNTFLGFVLPPRPIPGSGSGTDEDAWYMFFHNSNGRLN